MSDVHVFALVALALFAAIGLMGYKKRAWILTHPFVSGLACAIVLIVLVAAYMFWAGFGRISFISIVARTEIVDAIIGAQAENAAFSRVGLRDDHGGCFTPGVVVPSEGARVTVSRVGHALARVTVEAESGLIQVETPDRNRLEVQHFEADVDPACADPRAPFRLTLNGTMSIGEEPTIPTFGLSPAPAMLLEGDARLFVRAKLDEGFFPAGSAALPPGGRVSAMTGRDDSPVNWDAVIWISDEEGLHVSAVVDAPGLRLFPPGAGDEGLVLTATLFQQAFRDPSLQGWSLFFGAILACLTLGFTLGEALDACRVIVRQKTPTNETSKISPPQKGVREDQP